MGSLYPPRSKALTELWQSRLRRRSEGSPRTGNGGQMSGGLRPCSFSRRREGAIRAARGALEDDADGFRAAHDRGASHEIPARALKWSL
jgi:hypothetical protein